MANIVRDLGAVSAYALAVEQGYQGTETEFAQLMASYATVAENAAQSASDAESSAQDAEAAAESVQNLGVNATTLAAGSAATVTKSVDAQTGNVTLEFGIPTGPKGDTGATGAQGETGPAGAQGPAGVGIPTGGTRGQVLMKGSGTNYDTLWSDYAGGDVNSVNGQTGAVVLDAEDVGAIAEPATDGTNGQVLTTDGNGGRSWTTVQGGGGGAVDSVNGQTGTVVLDAGDLEYDSTASYTSGTVGAELSAKADKMDTVLSTTLSMGRQYGSTAGAASVALGNNLVASGSCSHAEGDSSTASGQSSHAEGNYTTASGYYSHAEGDTSTASGRSSHAEGIESTASGNYSHAEGDASTASGTASHAEGYATASGEASHAEGASTANHMFQHTFGGPNVPDPSGNTSDEPGNYIEIVGNSQNSQSQSNGRTLDWSGNERLAGDLYVGCNADSSGGTKVARESIVASEYDATAAYAVGAYCVYGGTLYCCNTAIASGGETWTAAHWTAITVGAELGDLKSQISDLEIYTPEMFGAVGDGTTDDSQAVQDACDAGYNVYFASNKTYYLASTVTIDHDIHLYGGEGATIKTATPSSGIAYNGIVVTGTLKKTTTLTTDYTSNGTTANSTNRFTLTDMTDIAIGDIIVIEATDQYYNYNRQYYYLGGTLLITDIYDGHIYTADSMPWDITNSANVTVTVYEAPTAIIENLRFESNGYFSGNYRYLLVLSMTKGSVVNNCAFTQMCSGIHLVSSVNAKVDNVSLSKSKYDNEMSGTGYGIVVNACSNTVIERVIATCAQHAITVTGFLPTVNLYIRNSYLSSECRVPGLYMHENIYNLVVEDCTLATASLYSISTLNRCRIINNRRINEESQGLAVYGSHRADWSRIRILDSVFDGTHINLPKPSVEAPIQAYDHIIGSLEIRNCIGGYLSYCPETSTDILSNTVNRLVIDNWQNVDKIYRAVGNSSIIKELVITNTTFNDWNFLGDNWTDHGIILDGIEYFSWDNKLMPLNKFMINRTSRGEYCMLPEGVPIQLSSSNASAVFRICGANITPNTVDDLLLGSVGGNVGSALVRTAGSNAGTISFDSDGNLVYSQASNTSNVAIYPVGICRVNDWSVACISANLKNTGTTGGASFRCYVLVVDGNTGDVVERRSSDAVQATAAGATLQHDSYTIKPGDLVLHYIYCATPVSGAITTFEDLSMTITPRFAAPVVNDTYTAKRRTGDGTLTSLAGVNNIMCSEDTFTVSLAADLNANPVGLLPTASGVNF